VLTIRLRGPREAAATLAALEGVTGVETLPDAGDGEWRLRIHFNEDPREAVARTAVARGWVLRDVQLERPALDDVFRRLAPPHAP
jgi:ABC-type uncharacterized transport system ATPase subunit